MPIHGSIALRSASLRRRSNSPSAGCEGNEQQHRCTYCSQTLIFCEAERTNSRAKHYISNDSRDLRNDARIALRARRRSRAMTTNLSVPYFGSAKSMHVPAKGTFRGRQPRRTVQGGGQCPVAAQRQAGIRQRLVSRSGNPGSDASRASRQELTRRSFYPSPPNFIVIAPSRFPLPARGERVGARGFFVGSDA